MSETADRDATRVRDTVRESYAEIARNQASGRVKSRCCGGPNTVTTTAQAVGYSEAELAELPEGANMGLSCGNPTALASLKPGEVVLDLGSGGGFDAFIAGRRVGAEGRVIGVDMTPDMLSAARGNVEAYRASSGLDNVEFRLGEIEHLPVADASVDVVISNCVINLSPDKSQVWGEIARVLRPGGRVAVSDLALLRPLPPTIAEMVEALVGCVAGAVLLDETRRMVAEAGLVDVEIEEKSGYVDAMVEWEDPLFRKIIDALPEDLTPGEYITSASITARRP